MAASRKGKNSMTVLALSVLAEAPRVACQVHGVVAGQQGAERWLQASPGRCATANGKQTGLDVEGGRYALWKNPENPTENQQAKLAWIAATDARLYRAYLLKEGLRVSFRLGVAHRPSSCASR